MSAYTPGPGAMVPVNTAEHPSLARKPQVYQIDFTAVASGKRIASTKRRVRWRFGFANPEALAAGETGTACRGEEHDITLVWSITSGKRLVLADGQEVHYSSSRGSKLDFSWTMRGNHVLKIVAHSSPPLNVAPGFRQYDFYVDGQSFFSFPKVFRLGLAPGDPRGGGQLAALGSGGGYGLGTRESANQHSSGLVSIEAPHNPDEEEAYLQEAIRNSLAETGPPAGAPGARISEEGRNLLLDFFDDSSVSSHPAPPQLTYGGQQQPAYAQQPAYGTQQQLAYGQQPAYGGYGSPAPATSGYPAPVYGGATPLAITGPAPAPPAYAPAPADPWAAPPVYAPAPTDAWAATPATTAPADPWAATPATTAPADPWAAPSVSALAPPVTPSFANAPQNQWGASTPSYKVATPGTPSTLGFASPQPQANSYANQVYPPVQEQAHAPGPQPDFSQQNFAVAPPQPDYGGGAPNFASMPTQDYGAPPQSFAAPSDFSAPQNFGSADFGGQPAPAPANEPALFSMSGLASHEETPAPAPSSNQQGLSLADQAYAKYASMGEFDLVSKKDVARANPFESAPIGGSLSLADMKKSSQPKKAVMNTPGMVTTPTNALVPVSNQQGNNWGQQAGYGMQQPSYGQQSPAAAYGQQAPAYVQQQPAVYGQTPSQQTGSSQMPQQSFGQAPAYGQSPPVQQNPYGGYSQQQF